MAQFKFNMNYKDKELKRIVKADEPVEMTIKRADEIVKNVKGQSDKFKSYDKFSYERLDEDKKQEEGK